MGALSHVGFLVQAVVFADEGLRGRVTGVHFLVIIIVAHGRSRWQSARLANATISKQVSVLGLDGLATCHVGIVLKVLADRLVRGHLEGVTFLHVHLVRVEAAVLSDYLERLRRLGAGCSRIILGAIAARAGSFR